jgi:hypothetical protein
MSTEQSKSLIVSSSAVASRRYTMDCMPPNTKSSQHSEHSAHASRHVMLDLVYKQRYGERKAFQACVAVSMFCWRLTK